MGRTKAKQLNIRVTEQDYQRIVSRAKKANVSISAFMLTMALKGKFTFVSGLPEISRELRFIGNNINQITRLSHEGKLKIINMDEFKKQMEVIWQSLNSLTRKAD